MKICPKCGNALGDDAKFCTLCGTKFAEPQAAAPKAEPQPEAPQPEAPQPEPAQYQQAAPQGAPVYEQAPNQQYQQPVYTQPAYSPFDHTSEYDAKDISDNKVVAMLPYLLGVTGVVVAALIGATTSPYTMFHVRQALKFSVVNALVGIITALLCWTVIVPIAGGILLAVLFVLRIICFFNVCNGKAVEAPIIRSLGFLK